MELNKIIIITKKKLNRNKTMLELIEASLILGSILGFYFQASGLRCRA
jgi:hypothetical protein